MKVEVLEPREIWKDVVGYEGLYKVSTLGRIKGVKYNKIMTGFERKAGKHYLYVSLYNGAGKSKDIRVHIIVMNALNPKSDASLTDIHHKDHNPHNNRLNNLVRLTAKEHSRLESCYRRNNPEYQAHIKQAAEKRRGKKYGPRKNLYRPVYCTDVTTGEFIKQYDSTRDTALDGYNTDAVSNNIRGKSESSGGVCWHLGVYK